MQSACEAIAKLYKAIEKLRRVHSAQQHSTHSNTTYTSHDINIMITCGLQHRVHTVVQEHELAPREVCVQILHHRQVVLFE
jgi:hypothetical protein